MYSEFFREILKKASRGDVLLLVLVPLPLTFLFILPETIQEDLVLHLESPNLLTAFTTHFVHGSSSHFLGNLTAYVSFVTLIYLLSLLSGERRKFYLIFLIFVLAFPFILSSIDLLLLELETSKGFSGINSAFLGFLPISLFYFLKRKFSSGLKTSNSISLFFLGCGIIAFIYSSQSILEMILIILIFGLSAFYFWRTFKELKCGEVRKSLGGPKEGGGYLELAIVSALFFILVLPVSAFPSELAQKGGTVNILSHYSGFLFGFMVPYFLFEVLEMEY